jgi:Transposase
VLKELNSRRPLVSCPLTSDLRRCYTNPHPCYCGIDLHARSMYVCLMSHAGAILLHRKMQAAPEPFRKAIAPYRDGLVVAVACIFTWYWLADLCAEEGIAFVLGHALSMQAIHGGKAKNDQIDSQKIAALLRGGMLPQAYVYPAAMRATRDLLRRRTHLMRKGLSFWLMSRIPPASTTCPTSAKRSLTRPTGAGWQNALTMPRCKKTSKSLSR